RAAQAACMCSRTAPSRARTQRRMHDIAPCIDTTRLIVSPRPDDTTSLITILMQLPIYCNKARPCLGLRQRAVEVTAATARMGLWPCTTRSDGVSRQRRSSSLFAQSEITRIFIPDHVKSPLITHALPAHGVRTLRKRAPDSRETPCGEEIMGLFK